VSEKNAGTVPGFLSTVWSDKLPGLASDWRNQPWASMVVSGERSRMVFVESLSPATEPLGCEPKIPRTYTCRPTSKNVSLFAFTDTFTSVFRGFRLSNSPRIGTALGQVPMICRQSGRIMAPNSRRSRSLSENGVIRKLRSGAECKTNTEIPFFSVRLRMGRVSLAVPKDVKRIRPKQPTTPQNS
jgi:hypothetical protein